MNGIYLVAAVTLLYGIAVVFEVAAARYPSALILGGYVVANIGLLFQMGGR
jgi:hypothetical protein